MQPIRYIVYQNTIWYNVMDYVQLLLDTNIIAQEKPILPHKRLRTSKAPDQLVIAKLNRLSARYQLRIDQELFADWVVFEHLHRVLKPFLVRPADWTNPDSSFHRIRVHIDQPKRPVESDISNDYFKEAPVEKFD